jgi:hypothetical protein
MDESPLTKKDRKRRGKLVANAEKQEGNKSKQSRGGRAKFNEIINQTCQKPRLPSESLGQGLPYLQT